MGLDRGDDGVLPILRHALQEADRRGAHLRVVRVLPPGVGRDDVVAADSSMGRLASLLPGPGSGPTRVEVVVGDPVEVLVERSVGALPLDSLPLGVRERSVAAAQLTCRSRPSQ